MLGVRSIACHLFACLLEKALLMLNNTLTKDEPYLKQLDQALKEVNDLHRQIHDALLKSESNLLEAYSLVNITWPKIIDLFTTLECLKANRREFDRGQDQSNL